jgi:pimeloyl-ACP methyl ester carboxylesterase
VLALDLPGHGESLGKATDKITAYAESTLKFMDQLEIGQAVLCGHSMGSAIVQRISLDHPQRVRGLVLVGGGARLKVHPSLIDDCRSEKNYPRAVTQILEWSFSQHADQRLVALAGERMKEVPASTLLAHLTACDSFDARSEVAGINQPTLIICGEDDLMTPVKFSRYLAEKIHAAQIMVIPGAGHMVMLEKPGVVAGLIDEFLEKLAQ